MDDAWEEFFDDDPGGVKQSTNTPRTKTIQWRSKTAFLRWLLELLRRGGKVTRARMTLHPTVEGQPRETWARGEAKKPGRRRTKARKPTETESERVKRLAAKRAQNYRARKKKGANT
jgi:hypothetical protein